MDPVTRALKAMYEEFPYPPSGAPQQRVGWDARLLLSYGKLAREKAGRIRVLDAGCGRGAGILGAATLQPDVEFVGIDINSVAIKEATEQARARNLKNVTFREVDLTTLEGLPVPSDGFDVVFSSGVVHHMPDPAAGLRKLRSVLAPHGLVQLMVYARDGRAPLYRVVRAVDLLIPRDAPIRDRLLVGRLLVSAVQSDAIHTGPWTDVATVDDSEFVDRYLNVNETSYSVRDLWSLLESADLSFLRWTEPEDWSIEGLLSGPLLELAQRMPERDRYALVEQLMWRPKLELVAGTKENGPRPEIPKDALLKTKLRVSPEVRFRTDVRRVQAGERVEQLFVQLRTREPVQIQSGPAATGVLVARELSGVATGDAFVREMEKNGCAREIAVEVVAELVRAEVLYAPHPLDFH